MVVLMLEEAQFDYGKSNGVGPCLERNFGELGRGAMTHGKRGHILELLAGQQQQQHRWAICDDELAMPTKDSYLTAVWGTVVVFFRAVYGSGQISRVGSGRVGSGWPAQTREILKSS